MPHSTAPRRRWRVRVIGLGLTLLAGLAAAFASATPAHATGGPDHSPLPWSVGLTASKYTLPLSQKTVLTATTNYDVGAESYILWVQIYDRMTGQKVGGCNTGKVCSVDVANPVGYSWTHQYVAYVSGLSATPPSVNLAESGPVFVTWSDSGYTLTMTKSTGYVYAWASKIIDGHGVLEIRNAYTNALLTSCTTGIVCYAPVAYGAYVAYLVPWGIAASSNTLYY